MPVASRYAACRAAILRFLDEGKPRLIRVFACTQTEERSNAQPQSVARRSVMRLLDKAPVDESIALYVLVNNQGLTVLQDYTTDRQALLKVLRTPLLPA